MNIFPGRSRFLARIFFFVVFVVVAAPLVFRASAIKYNLLGPRRIHYDPIIFRCDSWLVVVLVVAAFILHNSAFVLQEGFDISH